MRLKYPSRLTDVNGFRYQLKSQPRTAGLANYPAVYTLKGEDYFPTLAWIIEFRNSSGNPKSKPVMIRFF